jgi:hypothetical protein
MIIYVAKLSDEGDAVYVGRALNKNFLNNDLINLYLRTGERPIILEEYTDETSYGAESYVSLLAIRLKNKGYRIAEKINADNNRHLYVIYCDNLKSKNLYVGETGADIEIRFLQHKNNVDSDRGIHLSARIFRQGKFIPHSIAYDLILDKSTFKTKDLAVKAEAKLAAKLREMGYSVTSS